MDLKFSYCHWIKSWYWKDLISRFFGIWMVFVIYTAAGVEEIAGLDGPCVASEPASDQCAVENAECKTNGTAKGQCKVTHYVNVAACTIRKSPKVSCASGECVTHASCDCGTSKRVCDAGYDPSPIIGTTMCSGVVKVITQSYMFMIPILVSMMLPLR